MRTKLFLFLGILLAAWACNSAEEVPDPARLGYDFYPLEVGQYAIYDVEEIQYRPIDQTARNYQIKETVVDTITDLTHETAFLIYRYSRSNTTTPWKLDSAWVTKRTPYLAIRKENNVDFAKLSFPLKEGLRWNGNVFNNFGTEQYQATNLDQPYEVQDSIYQKTVTITQSDELNVVLKDRRVEVYARNTGLIYKERIQLKYVQAGGTVGNPGDIESGTYYILKIRESGIEK